MLEQISVHGKCYLMHMQFTRIIKCDLWGNRKHKTQREKQRKAIAWALSLEFLYSWPPHSDHTMLPKTELECNFTSLNWLLFTTTGYTTLFPPSTAGLCTATSVTLVWTWTHFRSILRCWNVYRSWPFNKMRSISNYRLLSMILWPSNHDLTHHSAWRSGLIILIKR